MVRALGGGSGAIGRWVNCTVAESTLVTASANRPVKKASDARSNCRLTEARSESVMVAAL